MPFMRDFHRLGFTDVGRYRAGQIPPSSIPTLGSHAFQGLGCGASTGPIDQSIAVDSIPEIPGNSLWQDVRWNGSYEGLRCLAPSPVGRLSTAKRTGTILRIHIESSFVKTRTDKCNAIAAFLQTFLLIQTKF